MDCLGNINCVSGRLNQPPHKSLIDNYSVSNKNDFGEAGKLVEEKVSAGVISLRPYFTEQLRSWEPPGNSICFFNFVLVKNAVSSMKSELFTLYILY